MRRRSSSSNSSVEARDSASVEVWDSGAEVGMTARMLEAKAPSVASRRLPGRSHAQAVAGCAAVTIQEEVAGKLTRRELICP